jgi:hypothetical protein
MKTLKTLMFAAAVSVPSATGAFAQGVDFSHGAPGIPPVSYTDGAGNALFPPQVGPEFAPYPAAAPLVSQAQLVAPHRYRVARRHVVHYAKIAR